MISIFFIKIKQQLFWSFIVIIMSVIVFMVLTKGIFYLKNTSSKFKMTLFFFLNEHSKVYALSLKFDVHVIEYVLMIPGLYVEIECLEFHQIILIHRMGNLNDLSALIIFAGQTPYQIVF